MNKQLNPEVICLGEALIDFIAADSGVPLSDVTAFKKAPGGAPANVAAGLSKLGCGSAFIGKVGDDAFGRYLEKVFIDAKINTSHMLFDRSARTGLAFVSLTAQGVPEFMFYRNPSADMLLDRNEIDDTFIRSAKAFHYGSITLISEPSKSATESAIKCALDGGLMISYDPNLRRPLWPNEDYARSTMLGAMTYPHIVKVSDEELAFLTGENDVVMGAQSLLSQFGNIKLLAVTKGSEGCFYATANQYGELSAFPVKAEDTTGAGDAFVAAMLYSLLEITKSPDEIPSLNADQLRNMFKFANAAAAITTTRNGAIPSLPSRKEVETFIKNSTRYSSEGYA